MTNDNKHDQSLEGFFAAERDNRATPSHDLLFRIMADAAEHIPLAKKSKPVEKAGVFARLLDVIGGWPSLAGLATASIVGVWVGYVQPAAVEQYTDLLITAGAETYLFEVSPANSIFGVEGSL